MSDSDPFCEPATVPAAGLERFGFGSSGDDWMHSLREAEAPLPFGRIGPYEMLEEVSRGGQGVVYRAVQPGTRRPAAIKRMLGGAFATPSMRRRFEREVEILSGLRHPNIVTAFAMDVVDGVPVLAMEWVEGRSITAWAAEESVGRAPDQIALMFLKVCDAIHHAHQRGVIHRDVKPSNILIDSAGEPHVLDFGLAKLVSVDGSQERSATVTDHFVGTLKYASPEQVAGRADGMDVRSDVYSLGVVLYEMLTGRLPYDLGEGFTSAARAIEQVEPLRPSSVARGLDHDFEAVVLKSLAKDKTARYQSVDAMAADIGRYLAGEPVSARTLGGVARLGRTLRRHRLAAAFGLTVFALVAVFAAVVTVMAARLAKERDAAVAAQRSEAAARHGTKNEEQTARSANVFLSQVLAPDESLIGTAREVGLREALNLAERRIEPELSHQPAVEATVRVAIGRAYGRLGLSEEAERHFQAALAIFRQLGEQENPDLFTTLSELATLWHSRGDSAVAISMGEELLVMYRKLLEDGRAPPYTDLTPMAALLSRRGDEQGIEALYRDTLAVHRRTFGDEHLVVAMDLHMLGDAVADDKEGEALHHEALEMHLRLLGEDHPQVAASHRRLAIFHHARGVFASAEPYYATALTLYRRTVGERQPIVGELLYDMGRMSRRMERPDDAIAQFDEALDILREALGEGHRDVATCRWRLGQTLLGVGELAEAEDHLRAALATWEHTLPAGHWRTAYAQSDLGACLMGLGEYTEAEEQLLSAHDALCLRPGLDATMVNETVGRLVELYEETAQTASAEQFRAMLGL